MWGEGASDLWRRLGDEADEHEAAALETIRARLAGGLRRPADDEEGLPPERQPLLPRIRVS